MTLTTTLIICLSRLFDFYSSLDSFFIYSDRTQYNSSFKGIKEGSCMT